MKELLELVLAALDRMADGEPFDKVVEETGVTARVCEALAIKTLSRHRGEVDHRCESNYDRGLDAARKGSQEVSAGFDDLALVGQPEAWSEKPFCRIVWHEDHGDPSVGIPARSGWSLAEDQAGTVVADLAMAASLPQIT